MLKKRLSVAATFTLAALALHADPAPEPQPTEAPLPIEAPAPEKVARPEAITQDEAKGEAVNVQQPEEVKTDPEPKAAEVIPTQEPSKPLPQIDEDKLPDEIAQAQKEQTNLAILNALASEKHKQETNELRAQVAKLKLEKELFSEELAAKSLKAGAVDVQELVDYENEKARLGRDAELAKIEFEYLTSQLKSIQTKALLATTELQAEISEIETRKKRDIYADAQPKYLDDPLLEDGTLVISDRRIPFNGAVTSRLADSITERINYYNNKDPKKPIFIVIDDSPGGSVMAGYRILKAMEGSEAPVYVVVKSFAASMAACITTLAERSFVYPNAVILHHQISQTYMLSSLNLTDQKEAYEDLKKWWHRLSDPISQKMGITSEEFIEMMYKKTVSGDWSEFGDDAVKLKWADHAVTRIQETSLLKDPAAPEPVAVVRTGQDYAADITPSIDDKGNQFMLLPRRNPKDVYLMYNPDEFYRFE